MSLVFRPSVRTEAYAPTDMCAAVAQYAGIPFQVRTTGSDTETLCLVGVSIDVFYGDVMAQDDPPVPSLHISLVGTTGTPESIQRVALDRIVQRGPEIADLFVAATTSGDALGDICHFPVDHPNGRGWMRLFVFGHALVLACEYVETLGAKTVAAMCAPNADDETRAGLGTILLPLTRSQHEKMALLAHMPTLATYLRTIIAEAADGNPHLLDLSIAV